MHEIIQFLLRNGYSVLFVWVFVEQLGLPVPSIPLLLAAGALVGSNGLDMRLVLGLPITAAVLSDALWYEVGRRRGASVLKFLCRISLEPDSCVRRTESAFERQGAKSLLLAKFIPGLGTTAPPLAGVFRMRFRRFLWFDVLGTLLWVGIYVGLGYGFSNQLEYVADKAVRLGALLVVLLLAALAAYIGWKYNNRRKFLHELRIARITPEELKRKIDTGEDLVIVDLRHSVDFEAEPITIPKAVRMDAEDLEQAASLIPTDRDVILYCT